MQELRESLITSPRLLFWSYFIVVFYCAATLIHHIVAIFKFEKYTNFSITIRSFFSLLSIFAIFIGELYSNKKLYNNDRQYFSVASKYLFPFYRFNTKTQRMKENDFLYLYRYSIYIIFIIALNFALMLFEVNQKNFILLSINLLFFYLYYIISTNYYESQSIGIEEATKILTPKIIFYCLFESLQISDNTKMISKYNNLTQLEILFRDFHKMKNEIFHFSKLDNAIKIQNAELNHTPVNESWSNELKKEFSLNETQLKNLCENLITLNPLKEGTCDWDKFINYYKLHKHYIKLSSQYYRQVASFKYLLITKLRSFHSFAWKATPAMNPENSSLSKSQISLSERTIVSPLIYVPMTNLRSLGFRRNEPDYSEEDFGIGTVHITANEITPRNLFVEIISPATSTSIIQGNLGDCWLIAGMLSLAIERPSLITELFVKYSMPYNESESVIFRFYPNGTLIELEIKDIFPCNAENSSPIFCHPIIGGSKKIIWPMIVEKAFALYYNKSYLSLDGGYIDIALAELSNGAVFRHDLQDLKSSGNGIIMMWDKLMYYFRHKYMIGAGTIDSKSSLPLALIEEHAYIITKVLYIDSLRLIEITTSDQNQIIGLKNGRESPSHQYSRRVRKGMRILNEERRSTYMASEVLINVNEKSSIWISYEQFTKYFNIIYACKIMSNDERTEIRFTDRWCNGRDGGCSNYMESFHNNPQYFMIIEQSTNIIIQLHLIVNSIQVMHPIGFELFSVTEELKEVSQSDYDLLNSVSTNFGGYLKCKIISLDINLSKGKYILIPTTFYPSVHYEFLLRLWVLKEHYDKLKIIKLK